MGGYPVALSQEEFISQVLADPSWRDFAVDSRKVKDGSVFFALPGERTDGHRFISAAISAGARAIVLNRSYFSSHEQSLLEMAGIGDHQDESPVSVPDGDDGCSGYSLCFVPVMDSLRCLQDAGAAVLATSKACKIGITGSNGKTGTKDMIAAVLGAVADVYASAGNFNSVIGLPVMAAGINGEADYAVFEMGMSEVGEMERLAEIVTPKLAIITNIGTAHIGNIGSREAIALEKFKIFSQMGADGIAIVPAGDAMVSYAMSSMNLSCRVLFYGMSPAFGYQELPSSKLSERCFRYRENEYVLNCTGDHQVHNALAVITAALELGMRPADISRGLADYQTPQGRGAIIGSKTLVVNDCYNANPESTSASIQSTVELYGKWRASGKNGRLELILGDMKELGASSAQGHQQIILQALQTPASEIYLYGEEYAAALESIDLKEAGQAAADRLISCPTFEDLRRRLSVEQGDMILIKASRSMELENILPDIPGLGDA